MLFKLGENVKLKDFSAIVEIKEFGTCLCGKPTILFEDPVTAEPDEMHAGDFVHP